MIPGLPNLHGPGPGPYSSGLRFQIIDENEVIHIDEIVDYETFSPEIPARHADVANKVRAGGLAVYLVITDPDRIVAPIIARYDPLVHWSRRN